MTGTSEAWVTEYLFDFDVFGSTITFSLFTFTRQDISVGGSYFIRIGGTPGVADGTTVLTLSSSQSSYPSIADFASGSSVSNPGGKKLVKITAHGSSFNARARFKNSLIQVA